MATSQITNFSNKRLTSNQMKSDNQENFNPVINGRMLRPPLRMIHIYTVAKKNYTKRHLLFPKLELKGCENGERWVRCTSIPDPIPQVCPDQERGGSRIDEQDAWCASIDMLVPGNVTIDPYAGSDNPTYYANSNGTNLICEGFWPSLNEEPTEEEIRRAENTRDSRYRYMTREAQRLAAVSTVQLNEFLQLNPDTHIAMDSLGLTATWHTHNEVKVTCPNCGDPIKQGVAFHKSSADVLCILDPDRAYKAGALTRERYELLTGATETVVRPRPQRG